ncbi:hypothetical protein CS8_016790 [Cupriavidus sp. 8B]
MIYIVKCISLRQSQQEWQVIEAYQAQFVLCLAPRWQARFAAFDADYPFPDSRVDAGLRRGYSLTASSPPASAAGLPVPPRARHAE